jgi:peptide/nickel transport system substrate-binding protein
VCRKDQKGEQAMKNGKRLQRLTTLMMALILLAAMTLTAAATEDKPFDVVITANVAGLDPLRTNDRASTYVNTQIYETLYFINREGEIEPLLADGMPEFASDNKSVVIKLRQGVTFHDGTPFNAEAVKYTFEMIKNPDFGSSRASLAASMESLEVLDEYTLKINLSYADGVLTAKLAHTNSAIVSPAAQAAQDLMVAPCGTGPYMFVSAVSGSNVMLTRFDGYWGDKPAIKDIVMTIILEESTALARLETGEADFIPSLAVESLPRVQSMQNVTLASHDSAQVFYVPLRPTSFINPLMANKDFRTAIIKAIDKESYVNYVLEGHATVANSVIGPKVFGYTPEAEAACIGFDLEGAKKLIADNGWADEAIHFLVPTSPVYTPMGEFFQANLKEAGFNNVKMEMIDWSAWLTESKTENRFDITLAAWSNVTRDGTELLEPNWDTKVSARNKINDAAFDQLVYESKTTVDNAKRIQALQAANILLMENAYVAPISNGENNFAYNSKDYTNVDLTADGSFYIKEFGTAK